jgi:hypothetical protein
MCENIRHHLVPCTPAKPNCREFDDENPVRQGTLGICSLGQVSPVSSDSLRPAAEHNSRLFQTRPRSSGSTPRCFEQAAKFEYFAIRLATNEARLPVQLSRFLCTIASPLSTARPLLLRLLDPLDEPRQPTLKRVCRRHILKRSYFARAKVLRTNVPFAFPDV